MIISMQDLLSDDQAVTASAASTNYIDRKAPGTPPNIGGNIASVAIYNDMGKGIPLPLLVQVTTAFETCTSIKVGIQADNDSAFGSATTVAETAAIAVASLIAGYKFPMLYIPEGVNERYVRLYYTVAGSNATAGNITACVGTEHADGGLEPAAFRT